MNKAAMPGPLPGVGCPGVGLSWTRELDPLIVEHPDLVGWIEFEPQTTWLVAGRGQLPRQPRAVLDHLQRLPGRKLVHSVAAPVGGTVQPDAHHLALLRETVRVLNAPYASEHLSFNATQGVSTGFFMPPRQTERQAHVIADNIGRLQDALGVPVAIENGTSYLRPRSDEMPDGEFFARVAELADCGLLLDLHNAYANAVNGRQPLADFLAVLPLHRVWELHLAGGMERDGFWLDAHSGAVPTPLWSLLDGLPARLPALQAVIFEIFPTFIAETGTTLVLEELCHMRKWLCGAAAEPELPNAATPCPGPLMLLQDGPIEVASIEAPSSDGGPWETALTSLLTGTSLALDDPAAGMWRVALASEPGVPLVRDLVYSFRASMVMQVLRLSTRLLLASVGPAALQLMMRDTFDHHPPAMFATLEAQVFADQILGHGLQVPYLSDLLRYELALMQTLVDSKARVVEFSFEPMPLLRALTDGRLPEEMLRAGHFEIELLPEPDFISPD